MEVNKVNQIYLNNVSVYDNDICLTEWQNGEGLDINVIKNNRYQTLIIDWDTLEEIYIASKILEKNKK